MAPAENDTEISTDAKVLDDLWKTTKGKGFTCFSRETIDAVISDNGLQNSTKILDEIGDKISRDAFLSWFLGKDTSDNKLYLAAMNCRVAILSASNIKKDETLVEQIWPGVIPPDNQDRELTDDDQKYFGRGHKHTTAVLIEHFLEVNRVDADLNKLLFKVHAPFIRGIKSQTRVNFEAKDFWNHAISPGRDLNDMVFEIPGCRSQENRKITASKNDNDLEANYNWLKRLAKDPANLRANMQKSRKTIDTTLDMPAWASVDLRLLEEGVAQDPDRVRDNSFLRLGDSAAEMDFEVSQWPMSEAGVIADDICTEKQLELIAFREKRSPLTQKQIGRRRGGLATEFLKEIMPTSSKEVALAEYQLRLARDKSTAQGILDALAEEGAKYVIYPEPLSRVWPKPEPSWTRRSKWFLALHQKRVSNMRLEEGEKGKYKALRNVSEKTPATMYRSWNAPEPKEIRRVGSAASGLSTWEAVSEFSEMSWQEVAEPAYRAANLAEDLSTEREIKVEPFDRRELETMPKNYIKEMRCFGKPPESVGLVMQAVLVIFGIQPLRKKNGGKDWWALAQTLLCAPNFAKKLLDFKMEIDASTMEKLDIYCADPKIHPENVRKASKAAEVFAKWVFEVRASSKIVENLKKAEGPLKAKCAPPAPIEVNELDCLCKSNLTELKSLSRPPREVSLLFEVVCTLIAGWDSSVQVQEDRSWELTKKRMGKVDALGVLKSVDGAIQSGDIPKSNVDCAMEKLKGFGEEMTPNRIRNKSAAAFGLAQWLHAVLNKHYNSPGGAGADSNTEATDANGSTTGGEKACWRDIGSDVSSSCGGTDTHSCGDSSNSVSPSCSETLSSEPLSPAAARC